MYTRGETPFAAAITTETETKLLTIDLDKIFVDTAAAKQDSGAAAPAKPTPATKPTKPRKGRGGKGKTG